MNQILPRSNMPEPPKLRVVHSTPADSPAYVQAVRYDVLQYKETANQDAVAESLADRIFGIHLKDVDRREQAACRFVATHALRSLNERWAKAAEDRAIAAGIEAMRTECGDAFVGLPSAQLNALARLLFSRMNAAHRELLEGTATVTPGEYLRIVGGK